MKEYINDHKYLDYLIFSSHNPKFDSHSISVPTFSIDILARTIFG